MSDSGNAGELPLRLGVSACLLGNEVRFDAGHKRDRFLTDLLGQFVEWVPVCPEVEAGLGVPRPALRLVRQGDAVRMVEIASGRDQTRRLQGHAARRVRALGALELSGYVLKKDSPSCGWMRVKVYGAGGAPKRDGQGIFAAQLTSAYPSLPIEDEGRLHDAKLRENFIERVFAYRRLRELFRGRWAHRHVIAFHTAHKLQLMAHSPSAYRELGRLVAEIKRFTRGDFRERYERGFMDALRHIASRGRNANVLQHAAGYLKTKLDAASRAELNGLIEDYRRGLIPLVVPVTLMAHHVRRFEIDYLAGQHFLEPHPKELMLRNHV